MEITVADWVIYGVSTFIVLFAYLIQLAGLLRPRTLGNYTATLAYSMLYVTREGVFYYIAMAAYCGGSGYLITGFTVKGAVFGLLLMAGIELAITYVKARCPKHKETLYESTLMAIVTRTLVAQAAQQKELEEARRRLK